MFFEKDFENIKIIILNKNYRLIKKILVVVNNLIKFNRNRFNKNLVIDNFDGDEIEYIHVFSFEVEVRWVV